MKQNRFKSTLKVAAALAITGIGAVSTTGTASAASTDNNQIEIQLGAIQLGYTTNNAWTTNPILLANALTQGTQALLATTTNKYTSYVVTGTPTNAPAAQTQAFRAQLYAATLAALSAPVTYTNKITPISVTVVNGKTGATTTVKVTTLGFNPALTTATKIAGITSARIPNLDAGFISNAVASTFKSTTNSFGVVFPVFGPQPSAAKVAAATTPSTVATLNTATGAAQLKNASAVAAASLTATLKNYATGTKQWAPVSKTTGPVTNPVTAYLPNYSIKEIGPIGNEQKPNLTGLADAASAVAASAINGLGAPNTNTSGVASIYGKSAPNVQSLSQSLIKAAIAFQKTSTSGATSTPNVPSYQSGALGAASLGLITQVAGNQNEGWGGQASTTITPVLNGIVRGAVAAAGATSLNLNAVATGVAQGFAAAYLQSCFNASAVSVSLNQFLNDNSNNNAILSAFTAAGVTSTTLKGSIASAISSGITQVYNAFNKTTGVWDLADFPISGAKGVNTFGYINGTGSPVTDTIGL